MKSLHRNCCYRLGDGDFFWLILLELTKNFIMRISEIIFSHLCCLILSYRTKTWSTSRAIANICDARRLQPFNVLLKLPFRSFSCLLSTDFSFAVNSTIFFCCNHSRALSTRFSSFKGRRNSIISRFLILILHWTIVLFKELHKNLTFRINLKLSSDKMNVKMTEKFKLWSSL